MLFCPGDSAVDWESSGQNNNIRLRTYMNCFSHPATLSVILTIKRWLS
jgi:hypothetical protein